MQKYDHHDFLLGYLKYEIKQVPGSREDITTDLLKADSLVKLIALMKGKIRDKSLGWEPSWYSDDVGVLKKS